MKILITGGCGFIGTHTAEYFLRNGHEVVVIDNLSRENTDLNLKHLRSVGLKDFYEEDIIDTKIIKNIFSIETESKIKIDAIIHLAAQVAVTCSVDNPYQDFYANAYGTLNILEAVRKYCPNAAFINASTNKVYGDLSHYHYHEYTSRYSLVGKPFGISEKEPLNFKTPYGCSKGAADQYVLDYAATYGLKTVSIRQSCIYGERQYGVEDQGWIAHFAISAIKEKPITIYGNGKQVRDALYVGDLVNLYERCIQGIRKVSGQSINAGGGFERTVSVLELIGILSNNYNFKIDFSDERTGDQKVFVSDNTKALDSLNWEPKTVIEEGFKKMINWIEENL